MPIRRGAIHRDPDVEYKLSQIEIDQDKNWAGKGITNIKQVAAGMSLGDIPVRNDSIIRSLVPGFSGYYLVSRGPGYMPVWAPFSTDWVKFFSAHMLLTHSEALVAPDHTVNETAAMTTAETHDNHYLEDVNMNATPTTAVVTPDHDEGLTAALATDLTYSVA